GPPDAVGVVVSVALFENGNGANRLSLSRNSFHSLPPHRADFPRMDLSKFYKWIHPRSKYQFQVRFRSVFNELGEERPRARRSGSPSQSQSPARISRALSILNARDRRVTVSPKVSRTPANRTTTSGRGSSRAALGGSCEISRHRSRMATGSEL